MDDPFELSLQVRSSEAYRVSLRLQALRRDYYVFQRNYEELWRLLTIASTPEQISRLYAQKNYALFLEITDEIDRLLHNFLASATSLVDHTRIFIKKYYIGHPFYKEYTSRKESHFVSDTITKFIHDLRNYNSHYHLTVTRGEVRYSAATETTSTSWSSDFILEKEMLVQWDNWTSASKAFLGKDTQPIVITDVIHRYHQNVQAFHTWMHERLHAVHAEELAWLEDMQSRIRAATDAP
jgi:hypothetical protein